MPTLRITVDWLDRAYHGAEWPPSPLRLYQAMMAGYAVHRHGDSAFEPAMRHLESLPVPTIHAPEVEKRSPVKSAVPNNDGERVLDLFARGNRTGAHKKARKTLTSRTRHSRSFKGTVTYEWEATTETARYLAAFEAIAMSVSAVGQGIDVAVARAELVERPTPVKGVRYSPSSTGRRKLNIPYPGALDVLDERHRRFRSRIGVHGVAGVPEPAHQQSGYQSELDLLPIRYEAFALMDLEERPLAFEGTRTMDVAIMVRHAVGVAARRADLASEAVFELTGHRGSRRIRVQPLPNVGHGHADGRIRRVMLMAPKSVDEENWFDVMSRLIWADLIPEGQREPIGMLAPIVGNDPILSKYCGEATVWTTATPVVLPGHDSRRGRSRPERIVGRLLRHAHIPEAMVNGVTMEPTARLRGSDIPARYGRPNHLSKYPCRHMSVRWTRPVTGPVVLGAGIGYGLGLFVPVDDRKWNANLRQAFNSGSDEGDNGNWTDSGAP